MKTFPFKTLHRDVIRHILICLALTQLCLWAIAICALQLAPIPQAATILMLLAIAIFTSVLVVKKVLRALSRVENALNASPLPIMLFDRQTQCCYENRAAHETLNHALLKEDGLLQSGNRAGASEPTIRRIEQGEDEYSVVRSPVYQSGRLSGTLLVFYNLCDILENYKSRAQLHEEMARLTYLYHHIYADFTESAEALARCTRQQAESLHTVVSIINDTLSGMPLEPGDLSELRDAVSTINDCIDSETAHAEDISQVAIEIAHAGHSLSNTAKVMENLVG